MQKRQLISVLAGDFLAGVARAFIYIRRLRRGFFLQQHLPRGQMRIRAFGASAQHPVAHAHAFARGKAAPVNGRSFRALLAALKERPAHLSPVHQAFYGVLVCVRYLIRIAAQTRPEVFCQVYQQLDQLSDQQNAQRGKNDRCQHIQNVFENPPEQRRFAGAVCQRAQIHAAASAVDQRLGRLFTQEKGDDGGDDPLEKVHSRLCCAANAFKIAGNNQRQRHQPCTHAVAQPHQARWALIACHALAERQFIERKQDEYEIQ